MLLFGGQSAEHDVSRVTAVAVAAALDPEKYEIVPVGITTDGQWLLASAAQHMLENARDALPTAFEVAGDAMPVPTVATRDAMNVDVVFPLLHGPYGEDGTVQGLLELAGLPYVGSGVLGSALCMDKYATKRMLEAAELPIPRYVAVHERDDPSVWRGAFELPCFVKPANMGSSVGVSKAHTRDELDAAVALALQFDEWVLVEECVRGREIEVAVLGDTGQGEPSVPGEVVPGAEFYTYADKYEDGIVKLLIPAPLTDEEVLSAQQLAADAFNVCRCDGMARVDLFLRDDGTFVINEVNTIPGFTPMSMYPMMWEASGVSYSALLDRLIDLAIVRHDRRARRAGRQR